MRVVARRARVISIHVLREEDDPPALIWSVARVRISIHVLREEDDLLKPLSSKLMVAFLSTSSARRTTRHWFSDARMHPISIHVLREEDDVFQVFFLAPMLISIHVLREEDDCPLYLQAIIVV